MAGVSVPMLVAAPVTAAYFGLYHMFKQWGLAAAGPERASLVILAAGASAELLTSVITIPSEVIKSRLQLGANPHRATGGLLEQTRNFAGIWDAGRCIYRRQGLPGLWAGMHSCLIQDTCLAGLVFLFYEHVRRLQRSAVRDAYLTQPPPRRRCGISWPPCRQASRLGHPCSWQGAWLVRQGQPSPTPWTSSPPAS